MPQETGIAPNSQLRETFSQIASTGDKTRVLQVMIENEELVPKERFEATGSIEEDFNKMKTLVSTDSNDSWLLITVSFDTIPVRHKMLYSSTKAPMKRSFGHVSDTYLVSDFDELTWKSYQSHIKRDDETGPMTVQEQELAEIRFEEKRITQGTDRFHTSSTLSFPCSDEAEEHIIRFGQGELQMVELDIDGDSEKIILKSSLESVTPEDVPIATDRPAYFLYRHHAKSRDSPSVIFIHVLCSHANVKMKMLFSSCKAALLSGMTSHFAVDRKLEWDVSDRGNFATEVFDDELKVFTSESHSKPKFAKPQGPKGARGDRRLIKGGQS